MKKLCLIATGGTIACKQGDNGLAPALNARDLLGYLDENTDNIDCIDLFNMDSSNIQPEEWVRIAQKLIEIADKYDGIIVTHGTDTMAYTSSMLSFMLKGLDIPVVLTGSQYPICIAGTDAVDNLSQSIAAAKHLEGGVYVCFGASVIKGCRAVKTRTTSFKAFESINYPYIARFRHGMFEREIPIEEHDSFDSFLDIESRVALVKLIPGTLPSTIECLMDCGVKGVVVEAFGLGGVHNFRRDHAHSIGKLIEAGIPVVLASQCLYEASTPDIYEVSGNLRDAGVISAGDMTTEAAVTKLMYALGKSKDMKEIRRIMKENICGEISR